MKLPLALLLKVLRTGDRSCGNRWYPVEAEDEDEDADEESDEEQVQSPHTLEQSNLTMIC